MSFLAAPALSSCPARNSLDPVMPLSTPTLPSSSTQSAVPAQPAAPSLTAVPAPPAAPAPSTSQRDSRK
eukprot:1542905-Rhodomonas_salina.1